MGLRSIVNRVVKPPLVSRIKALILKSDLLVTLFHLRYFSINSLDKKLEKYLDFNNFQKILYNLKTHRKNSLRTNLICCKAHF